MRRLMLLFVVPVALLVASGCVSGSKVYGVQQQAAISKVGSTAAGIARSRAMAYDDMRDTIRAECRAIEKRRREYLSDAERYRQRAARATFDKGLTSWERRAYSEMYQSIAVDREEAAKRCKELVGAYQSRISIISSRINSQEADAADFAARKMAAPK